MRRPPGYAFSAESGHQPLILVHRFSPLAAFDWPLGSHSGEALVQFTILALFISSLSKRVLSSASLNTLIREAVPVCSALAALSLRALIVARQDSLVKSKWKHNPEEREKKTTKAKPKCIRQVATKAHLLQAVSLCPHSTHTVGTLDSSVPAG
jgi:hypothetical protein